MSSVEKSIEVNVPVSAAYNQWTQFEEFPRFMSAVEEVRQLDDTRMRWKATIGGQTEEWEAKVTRQEPDRVVAWESTSGATNGGEVTFQPIGVDRARVTVRMEFEPRTATERTGEALGMVDRSVEGDLKRFKEFIESRGRETGAWRGEVRGGQVEEGMGSSAL